MSIASSGWEFAEDDFSNAELGKQTISPKFSKEDSLSVVSLGDDSFQDALPLTRQISHDSSVRSPNHVGDINPQKAFAASQLSEKSFSDFSLVNVNQEDPVLVNRSVGATSIGDFSFARDPKNSVRSFSSNMPSSTCTFVNVPDPKDDVRSFKSAVICAPSMASSNNGTTCEGVSKLHFRPFCIPKSDACSSNRYSRKGWTLLKGKYNGKSSRLDPICEENDGPTLSLSDFKPLLKAVVSQPIDNLTILANDIALSGSLELGNELDGCIPCGAKRLDLNQMPLLFEQLRKRLFTKLVSRNADRKITWLQLHPATRKCLMPLGEDAHDHVRAIFEVHETVRMEELVHEVFDYECYEILQNPPYARKTILGSLREQLQVHQDLQPKEEYPRLPVPRQFNSCNIDLGGLLPTDIDPLEMQSNFGSEFYQESLADTMIYDDNEPFSVGYGNRHYIRETAASRKFHH